MIYTYLKKKVHWSSVNSTMNVLILGAQGMLGQELVLEGQRLGHKIIALDRDQIDVAASDAEEKLAALAPEVIINAIGYNAVDEAETPEGFIRAQQLNAEIPERLARLARILGIPFIHYSSDFVFDGENEDGYAEDAMPHPINAYGRSKVDGEVRLQKIGGHYYLIRISRLFGAPATSSLGKKSFVDVMKGLAFEKPEINLVDSERGTPTYAPDCATATFALLADHAPAGIYHLANSESCTWYEFGKAVFKELSAPIIARPVGPEVFPRPAQRPRVSPLINTKRPQARSWRVALHEYLYGAT